MPIVDSGAEVRLKAILDGKVDAGFVQVQKNLDDLERRVDASIAQNADSRQSWQQAGMSIADFGKSVGIAAGIITGAGVAIKKGLDFAEAGANFQRLRDSADDLASHYGENMTQMLGTLQEFARGTVSNSDLILAADKAMMLGVSADAEQLGNLLQVAALRGRAMGQSTTEAFNDIVTGIGRMSPKILDNLGIIVDAQATYEDYAKSIGKSADALTPLEKRQALLTRVLEEGNKMLDDAGGLADDNKAAFERMDASWANFVTNIQATAAPAGASLADAAAKALDGWGQFFQFLNSQSQIREIQINLKQSDPGAGRDLTTYAEQATAIWAQQQRMIAGTASEFENYEDAGVRAAKRTAEAMGEVAPAIEEAAYNTEDLLGVTEDLQKIDEKYRDTLSDIADKRAEINDNLKKHKIRAKDAAEAMRELDEAERAANEAAVESSKEVVFGLISQKLAAEGNYAAILKIGESFGMITPTVATAGENILGILNDGRMSAEQQASAIAGIARSLFNTSDASSIVGPATAENLGPMHDMLIDSKQEAASLKEQIWSLKQAQGSYDYYFNLHVNGSLPAIGSLPGMPGIPGGGNCFIPGTLIDMANGNRKPIEDVRAGDHVLSMDPETCELLTATVLEIFAHTPEEHSAGYLLINDTIGVTHEHPIYVGGEWKPAGRIRLGDELLDKQGNPVLVISIRWVERPVFTFNLSVDHETHNYFADGVLVHNKEVGGEFSSFAEGGQMQGAGWKMVGEAGYELVSPTGYVFPHAQSRALIAAGLVPGEQLRIGGYMSEDEAAYYRHRPLGDIEERRARRHDDEEDVPATAASSRRKRSQGGGSSSGMTQAVQAITALATQTASMAGSVEFGAQQQTQATRDSTVTLAAGNESMVGELRDIRRLLSRLPSASDQIQLARAGAAQSV